MANDIKGVLEKRASETGKQETRLTRNMSIPDMIKIDRKSVV